MLLCPGLRQMALNWPCHSTLYSTDYLMYIVIFLLLGAQSQAIWKSDGSVAGHQSKLNDLPIFQFLMSVAGKCEQTKQFRIHFPNYHYFHTEKHFVFMYPIPWTLYPGPQCLPVCSDSEGKHGTKRDIQGSAMIHVSQDTCTLHRMMGKQPL